LLFFALSMQQAFTTMRHQLLLNHHVIWLLLLGLNPET